jgi:hypothetical protein
MCDGMYEPWLNYEVVQVIELTLKAIGLTIAAKFVGAYVARGKAFAQCRANKAEVLRLQSALADAEVRMLEAEEAARFANQLLSPLVQRDGPR